jgi:ribosomal-protein-alanine N-acetyltransferase
MRHRDFGQPTGVKLVVEDVCVSTTFPEDSKVVQKIQKENKSFLDPWRIPMNTDSSETKILSIRYKDQIVGQIILWNFQEKYVKSCSISYWVIKEFTNMGVGTSAVNLVCEYAFNELGVDEIDATIQPENTPSIKLIEKLKFPHRKTIGEYEVFQGRWQGYTVYTIMKEQRGDLRL